MCGITFCPYHSVGTRNSISIHYLDNQGMPNIIYSEWLTTLSLFLSGLGDYGPLDYTMTAVGMTSLEGRHVVVAMPTNHGNLYIHLYHETNTRISRCIDQYIHLSYRIISYH